MKTSHVEILVEELSMEAALRLIVPKIIDVSFEVYPFQCKEDLFAKLPSRLHGYRDWLPNDWRILVVVDRDDEDCNRLKKRLERIARDCGLTTRAETRGPNWTVVNRLAVEELEAWYFGDWEAVKAAYPRVDPNIPNKAKYRDPDAIAGGTWEAIERVLKRAGYFKTGLRKIEAAAAIAQHMSPQRNQSRSFRALADVLTEMGDC